MKPNTERLRKLADHLLNGKLGHEKFDLSFYNIGSVMQKNGCGTIGCSIGECPIVFPEEWIFDSQRLYIPVLKSISKSISIKPISDSGCLFFGISLYDFCILFTPSSTSVNQLQPSATKEDAARHIIKFCEEVERED